MMLVAGPSAGVRGGRNDGFVYREQVGAEARGLTLLAYLAARHRHSTRQEWRRRIEEGRVRLDDRLASPEAPLRSGAVLTWRRPPWREPAVPLSFAVLHEDLHLLAVAKPAGLPTLPAGGFLQHTLLARVRRCYPEARPAHRLGRGTSGVLLMGRTRQARRGLAEAWRRRRVVRIYRALVAGRPERDRFRVDRPIGTLPHAILGSVHAACAGGRAAHSAVRVLERRAGAAVVEVCIETGRPHQVRIHLAAAGHPLVGDPLYVPGGVPRPATRSLPGDTGYLLHAERVLLDHPASGQRLEIGCAPPPALRLAAEAQASGR